MERLRNNGVKTAVSVLLGVLLCLGCFMTVSAESTLQIGIDQYSVSDDGHITVYVNHNEEQSFNPTTADSSLLIGKNTLEIESIKPFSDTGEPVTYLCLIDISGSMTDSGIEQTKEVLKELADTKGAQDNICITTMGNDVESSGFLSDSDKLTEAIDGIERISTEDTNLYYGITEALNVLKTDKQVHNKRCLLIFSDGEDDQKKGITEKEAEDAVKDSHIPVFTIAMQGSNLKDEEGSTKILGSFARNSAGGESYTPHLDDTYDYADICEKINVRLKNSLVITASLENIKEIGDDTVYIGLELSDGSKKVSDGITVPAGSILEAIEAIEAVEVTEDKTEVNYTIINESTQEETQPEEPESNNKYILIGLIALLVILVVALIILISRKKAREEEETSDSGIYDGGFGGSYDTAADSGQRFAGGSTYAPLSGAESGDSFSEQEDNAPKAKRNKDKIEVTLYKVGPGEDEKYQLTVKDEVTIGRSRNCQLSLQEDSALSGKHCSIIYRDGYVFVRDEKSTNGTYANGVPIVGEFRVERDDILLIGSSEYRISWE